MSAKPRDNNFDLLRVLCCVSVILQHIAAIYIDDYFASEYTRSAFAFCDFIQSITRYAVPCFVMLSGAYLIDNNNILNLKNFYHRSLEKLLIPTLVFSIFAYIYRFLRGDNIYSIVIDAISGEPMGHLWYIYMISGLYFIAPFVVWFKNNVKAKTFVCFSIILVVLQCIIKFTCILIWPIEFIMYLGYFTIGYCIKKYISTIKYSGKLYLLLGIVMFSLVFVLNEHYFDTHLMSTIIYRNPNYPVVIMGSICIFIAFSKMQINDMSSIAKLISKHSLIIYLSHAFIVGIINKCITLFIGRLPSPYFYVPILFLICLFSSVIVSMVYNYIINFVRKKYLAK